LDSWSKYNSICDSDAVANIRAALRHGNDVSQMMKVVGEEGTAIEDFIDYLKGELIDAVYLQQDSFHAVDAACSAERQRYIFNMLTRIINSNMNFEDRDVARRFFHQLTQTMRDWNSAEWKSDAFNEQEKRIETALASVIK
jgi:V/A-type H+-transporting ATPase subunit A